RMWLCAAAAVAVSTRNVTAPVATVVARRATVIGRDSRKRGPRRQPRGSEREGGCEPPTYHLRGGCSTPELLRRRAQDTAVCEHHGPPWRPPPFRRRLRTVNMRP